MSSASYARRRERVLDLVGERGALVIAAAPELHGGRDAELRYHPDPDLFYLTGIAEPETVLVLCPSAPQPFTLFVRPRDAELERWSGVRGGEAAAMEVWGADAAHPVTQMRDLLPRLLAGADTLYCALHSARPDVDAALRAAVDAGRRARPRTGRGVHTLRDADLLLGPMRLHKDDHEIGELRDAARITCDAFRDAAAVVRNAAGEWQVEAVLEHGFRIRGATGPSFPTIVAGATNATVLHYRDSAAPLRPGSLLLIDAGARVRMYCGDVSRTFPVSGTFTAEQRVMYDAVQRAHAAALAAAVPGNAVDAIDAAAVRVLTEGMIELGLLAGSVDDAVEQRLYRRYYPHRTSHWLGLDVHDAGPYADEDGTAVTLGAGMVLTIEPGLYIPPDDTRAPASLQGTGMRLEDDVLLTAEGAEVLTSSLPLDADAIEQMMK